MSYCFVQTFHFLSLFPSPQCIPRHPGRFSLALEVGRPPPKPGKRALRTRLISRTACNMEYMIDKIQTKLTRVFRLSPLAWIEQHNL